MYDIIRCVDKFNMQQICNSMTINAAIFVSRVGSAAQMKVIKQVGGKSKLE